MCSGDAQPGVGLGIGRWFSTCKAHIAVPADILSIDRAGFTEGHQRTTAIADRPEFSLGHGQTRLVNHGDSHSAPVEAAY